MKATEQRMRELGLLDPLATLALDEWEVEREHVIINRKLGEGAFGMVYGGEMSDGHKQWVRLSQPKEYFRGGEYFQIFSSLI